MYVGVFDDDGGWAVDDLAGRVVIDIARLRHSCTYDVVLPLRMSAQLYQRKKRGAVRLRFSLEWKTEKDVLYSYIPKKIKICCHPSDIEVIESALLILSDEKEFKLTFKSPKIKLFDYFN